MKIDSGTVSLIKKSAKNVLSKIRKVFIGIFGVLSGINFFLAVLFILLLFVSKVFLPFLPIGIITLGVSVAFFTFSMLLRKAGKYNRRFSKQHFYDIKICEDISLKLKKTINESKNKHEFKFIIKELSDNLKVAKSIFRKIERIDKIMRKSPEWDLNIIKENLKQASSSNPQNTFLIDQLTLQIKNAEKLNTQEEELRKELSNVKTDFNTIFAKYMDLSNSEEEKQKYDEVGTEIQKILDRKAKVKQFEKQLDEEIKEFL